MRKSITAIMLFAIFCLTMTMAEGEKVEWYFPIVKFNNGGNSCSNGESFIIYPGSVEDLKPGQTYKMYRKGDGVMKYVADIKVNWIDMWESSVTVTLNQGETSLLITDMVKVKVDLEKGFNFWWEKGVKWEEQNNCYDAFRAYYRCKLYRPGDANVENSYRRTGYGDYLNQGIQAMKQKKYRSAISLFKYSLQFTWPGGDQSKAKDLIKECEGLLTTQKDTLGERLASVYKSIEEERYYEGLCNIRDIWLSYTSVFGKDEEKVEAQKQMKLAWKSAWREAKKTVSKLLRKKEYDEAYKIVFAMGKFIPIVEDLNPKEYFATREKIEKSLPEGSMGYTICTALESLKALQQEDGSFAISPETTPNDRAMLTGLAIAAFARAGNTLKTGMYSPVLAKAWEYIISHKTPEGALFVTDSITPHIVCTFGIAELLNESGDDDIRGTVEPCVRYMTKKQESKGDFGRTTGGIDTLFDLAFASVAYHTASESGIIVPMIVLDKLKENAYNLAGTAGAPKLWMGGDPTDGSPQQVFALGSVLTMIRATGGDLVGKHGMPMLQKTLSITPDPSVFSPEGWYLIAWAQSEFSNDQWTKFRKGMMSVCNATCIGQSQMNRKDMNTAITTDISKLFCLNCLEFAFQRDFAPFDCEKE